MNAPLDLVALMTEMGRKARAAASVLAQASAEDKQKAIHAAADALDAARAEVLAANAEDMAAGAERGMSSAFLDRLKLDDKRIDGIVSALRVVADL
ncbi:MAG: gamma-glutamyl-phosphate reductase, partial [Devosia sp.]